MEFKDVKEFIEANMESDEVKDIFRGFVKDRALMRF